MNSQLASQVIRYVTVSSALGKRALDEVKAHRQMAKAAADIAPPLVQKMIDAGLLDPTQKTACEQILAGDPAKTLQILNNAVTKLAAAKAELKNTKAASADPKAGDRLGKPEKTAGDGLGIPNSNTIIVGSRSSELRDSDRRLLSGLGLTQLANKQ